MARKLGCLLALTVMAVSAYGAALPGAISGYVKNVSGVPQMGVAVEIVSLRALHGATVFTDARGYYKASGLSAGTYQVKASAPSYLPSLRENIALRAGANLIVNLTLTTLFEAVQWLPPHRTSPQQDDDWKWTLRTVTSRPILRMLEPDTATTTKSKDRTLKAQVSFIAGSENEGFGSAADMTTQFRLDQSIFSAGTLTLGGNVGYGSGTPAAVVRAAYSHQMANGSHPEMALTVRRFAMPGAVQHDAALDALAFSVADGMTLADLIELNFGGDFQAIDFRGAATAFRPYGSAVVHVSPNTVVQYRYATSEPNTRLAKGFDTAPADLSESGPRVSLRGDRALLEHAQHHELSLSHRLGNNQVQVAAFSDHVRDAALVGAGEVSADSGEFLPDVYSGTFTYNGGELSTQGVRVVVERNLLPNLTATVDYGYGGVIALPGSGISWQEARALLRVEHRHAAALKLAGGVPHCKTHWIASYKWTSGPALTPVDMFNASPGESDPYLNFFLRQPLPSWFVPGHMEALLDLRNLLAQGYIPVLGQDGQTLYLVQSARSIRGGLAFTF
jgi:Carboxypeptidase regulatory-like domain